MLYTCTLSLMPFPRLTGQLSASNSTLQSQQWRDVRAVTSWSVSIVLTTLQIIAVVILEFFLEWQGVEFASQGKLAVDFFLANIEVLDVEEACYMSIGPMRKMLALYLPTCWTAWLNCLTSSSFPPGCSYRLRSRVINSAQSTVAY